MYISKEGEEERGKDEAPEETDYKGTVYIITLKSVGEGC